MDQEKNGKPVTTQKQTKPIMDKYQKVAVHALIKNEKGEFLVIKRSPANDFLPNLYDLPGGSVEISETPECALLREIEEETGLSVEIMRPVFNFTEFQNNSRHQFWLIYECRYLSGEIRLNPEEHSEYFWANLEDISSLPKIVYLNELINSKFIVNS